jgi:hypothetical protein
LLRIAGLAPRTLCNTGKGCGTLKSEIDGELQRQECGTSLLL